MTLTQFGKELFTDSLSGLPNREIGQFLRIKSQPAPVNPDQREGTP